MSLILQRRNPRLPVVSTIPFSLRRSDATRGRLITSQHIAVHRRSSHELSLLATARPSTVALVGVPRHARTISFMSTPRYLFQMFRFPITVFGVGAGAAGYANYKLHEFSEKITPSWLPELVSDAKGVFSSIANADWHLPSFGQNGNDDTLNRDVYISEAARYNRDLMGSSSSSSSSSSDSNSGSNDDSGNSGNSNQPSDTPPTSVIAAVAAFGAGLRTRDEQEPGNGESDQGSTEFMALTRTLIEIRNLLKTVKHDGTLQLPSIVVIGSQSSGKSSVLEAIVGNEFLPKGSNMVTRRPIELTLIHTPESKEEYGEFPQLGLGKLKDFSRIRQTLTDLNLAVSDEECISADPIELRIYSPNVPDLTLVDLPGYIQVHNRKQPEMLKQKIASLCEAYIREPNIILAVCAADVDLANSEALLASRRADPLGVRTIGVLTKMDLVPPTDGVEILRNQDYPLMLGYVGVVSRQRKSRSTSSKELIKAGNAYFQEHEEYRQPDLQVGTDFLKRKLIKVLEENMRRNLHRIVDAVQAELDETRYQYKVHYNDRPISAESYAADSLDTLKQAFKQFSHQFDRSTVRTSVRTMLEQRALDICARIYWSDRKISELPKSTLDDFYWQHKLDVGVSSLTKCGIGRLSTQLVMDVLKHNLTRLVEVEPFPYHPDTQRNVMGFGNDILRRKFHFAMDQVENTIKPFKFEVDCTQSEWESSVERATKLLEREMDMCARALKDINTRVGKRTLNSAINYIQETSNNAAALGWHAPQPAPVSTRSTSTMNSAATTTTTTTTKNKITNATGTETTKENNETKGESESSQASLSPAILEEAKLALSLRDRATVLKLRHAALRGKQCRDRKNRSQCPEAFLNLVADKLTNAAVMFLQVELLNEFFFQFPRELDSKLYFGLDKDHVLAFAKENPRVLQQLELMDRKKKLEEVMDKLGYVTRQQERMAV
ncbi:P-loop containing nucleoside triphosphate hydrolase protein [Syncephalis plumigaleata]|nr:P-loop containing nucleoside triphosphate hydrolase protein [Syncephalis plumigaleata]